MPEYLTAADLSGPTRLTIKAVRQEEIRGTPRIVVYFEDEPRGLVLTREMAEVLTQIFGRHPLVDKHFKLH